MRESMLSNDSISQSCEWYWSVPGDY